MTDPEARRPRAAASRSAGLRRISSGSPSTDAVSLIMQPAKPSASTVGPDAAPPPHPASAGIASARTSVRARIRLHAVQRGGDVGEQVVTRLDARREADEAFAHVVGAPARAPFG